MALAGFRLQALELRHCLIRQVKIPEITYPPLVQCIANGSGPSDESIDANVDTGRDEDGSDDDHEVLDDEPDDVVRIVLGRKRAEDVADGLQEAG